MKITMNLPVEPAVFFKQLQLSALADIRTHTGREPLAGNLYREVCAGLAMLKNGRMVGGRGWRLPTWSRTKSMLIHWQRRKTTFALAIA